MAEIIALNLLLQMPDQQQAAVLDGRREVFRLTKEYSNACGTTAAAVLRMAGMFDLDTQRRRGFARAQNLADFVQDELHWTRIDIEHISEGQPGDLAVCIDANHNGWTDHVGFLTSKPWYDEVRGRYYAEFFDNRINEFGGKPYKRNLTGEHGYTPVAYLLRRPPDERVNLSGPTGDYTRRCFQLFKEFYESGVYDKAPDELKQIINRGANHYWTQHGGKR